MYSHRSLRRIVNIFHHINPTTRSLMASSNECSAGIIVIGDEILKGQTADTNSHFICEHLFSWGVKVKRVPSTARLVYGISKKTGEKNKFPTVVMKNVCVFPGVPSILERSFVTLEDLFKNSAGKRYTEEIYVDKDEVSITSVLNDFNDKHRKEIILGSYPDFTNRYYKVKLTLEAKEAGILRQAKQNLIDKLPKGSVVNFDMDVVAYAAERVYSVLQSHTVDAQFRDKLQHSIGIIEQSLGRYSLEKTCIGFNGGKDCTAVLYLFHAVVKRKHPDHTDKLKALYIRSGQPFQEVEQFIEMSSDRYNLDRIILKGRTQDCLRELRHKHSNIEAIIMGTRNTDPRGSQLEGFAWTDPDWPKFMRVNPILDWSYSDVWYFLRSLYIDYCSLYDQGYTSLGSQDNTHPNPILQYRDDRGVVCYRPAYLLQDGDRERDGRNT
ncbi:FAD synthase-like isoform X2 [Ylistrum balloti]|uniref:FAD synthase-like isoform X2 n=1 Tax=Ylistrum balloti TaxID=509963 RepID=UPI002905E9BD|nr:FAD synthase-like isoform X2 [Ylistrum balloti]